MSEYRLTKSLKKTAWTFVNLLPIIIGMLLLTSLTVELPLLALMIHYFGPPARLCFVCICSDFPSCATNGGEKCGPGLFRASLTRQHIFGTTIGNAESDKWNAGFLKTVPELLLA
jgi:hypothetical protein